jgi:uncharacterized OB-fold protein
MAEKIFNPEKYGMVFCPCCNSHGYVQNPERQCCPKCGGFGSVKRSRKEGGIFQAVIISSRQSLERAGGELKSWDKGLQKSSFIERGKGAFD